MIPAWISTRVDRIIHRLCRKHLKCGRIVHSRRRYVETVERDSQSHWEPCYDRRTHRSRYRRQSERRASGCKIFVAHGVTVFVGSGDLARGDIAANATGTKGEPGLAVHRSADSYAATFDTIVLAKIVSIKHELRVMQAQGSGSIVNISSSYVTREAQGRRSMPLASMPSQA
jgi:NAD(P)-dependent dehydrogenase (short-subunit alcohol dehydrogenase family)